MVVAWKIGEQPKRPTTSHIALWFGERWISSPSRLRRTIRITGRTDVANWMQDAVPASHKGRLHRALGIPEGQKIPASRLATARHSDNPHMRQMANLAATFAHHRPGNKFAHRSG